MWVVQSDGKSVTHTWSTYRNHPVGNVSKLRNLHGSQDCYIDVTTTAGQNMKQNNRLTLPHITHPCSVQNLARHKSPFSLVVRASDPWPGFDSSETPMAVIIQLKLLQQPLSEKHYNILRLTAKGEQKRQIFEVFRNFLNFFNFLVSLSQYIRISRIIINWLWWKGDQIMQGWYVMGN